MAYTPTDVFNAAMKLSDNGDESSTNTSPILISDNQEYKNRALEIMNILLGELYPYSDTYTDKTPTAKKRTVPDPITDWDTEIDLDYYCAMTVMPYGLAANLFVTEDPTLASYCEQRYEELLKRLIAGMPGMGAEAVAIDDVYGGSYTDPDTGETKYFNQYGFQYVGRWW